MNYHQVSRIEISPELIECIVFWTKNAIPLMDYLDELERMGYMYMFQYSHQSLVQMNHYRLHESKDPKEHPFPNIFLVRLVYVHLRLEKRKNRCLFYTDNYRKGQYCLLASLLSCIG